MWVCRHDPFGLRAARLDSSLLRPPRPRWQHRAVSITPPRTRRFALVASFTLIAACSNAARVGGSGSGGEGGSGGEEPPASTGGTKGTSTPDASSPTGGKGPAPVATGGTGGTEQTPPDAAAG